MKKFLAVGLLVCFVPAVSSAEMVCGIDLDFVTIGNPGNAGEQLRLPYDTIAYGDVDYVYRIGKYEITANQWQTINTVAGIGDPGYRSGNQPVTNISWYDAARFCNYLTTGNKETGVYTLSGNSVISIMDHETAGSTFETAYFLPTEDEWYKAAYYTGSDYSLYANGTDTAPSTSQTRYYQSISGGPWDVGSGAEEQNGTFDMMGNVSEWNETEINYSIPPRLGVRGGSFTSSTREINSHYRLGAQFPTDEIGNLGFRIASIPEPASLLLLGIGAAMMRRSK